MTAYCPHCGGPLDAPAQPQVAPIDPEAFAAGRLDGAFGRLDDSRWPAGQPGHASYHLGHREGEVARQ